MASRLTGCSLLSEAVTLFESDTPASHLDGNRVGLFWSKDVGAMREEGHTQTFTKCHKLPSHRSHVYMYMCIFQPLRFPCEDCVVSSFNIRDPRPGEVAQLIVTKLGFKVMSLALQRPCHIVATASLAP